MDETMAKVMKDPIGVDEIRHATEILKDYKKGKQNLEDKITKNEDWYKGRHWRWIPIPRQTSYPGKRMMCRKQICCRLLSR